MAQKINIGNQSNDGTGDSIRDAFRKVNENFAELYAVNNLGGGLYFTKLKDAPTELIASTATSPAVVVSNNFGSALLQKKLVAGQGININNTQDDTITIENPNSSLSTDQFPELAGNLNGNTYRAVNFGNPRNPQDLVTLDYFEKNSIYSRVNLFVSLNGTDAGQTNFPLERRGRSLAYAYRTLSAACQRAEEIINDAPLELSVYTHDLTYNNGATTATVYLTTASIAIPGDITLKVNVSSYAGTDAFINNDIRPGQYIKGVYSETLAFIDDLSSTTEGTDTVEYYEVRYSFNPTGNGFAVGEPLLYGTQASTAQITIFIESGEYYEHLPIRVPSGVSLRGDEFRRTIIRPAPLISESPWANLWFRRDDRFDGMTKDTNNGITGLAPLGDLFGYHYLTDPSDPESTPKDNRDMDVFLLNDTTILRGIAAQGHGGFMCVLDPEGQILTKSPYIQQCSSFTRTLDKQMFSGGMYVDGFSGNLSAQPTDASTYFLGTTTIAVTDLFREPQTPCSFYYLGNRYEIDYVTEWDPQANTAVLHLNPQNPGGIAYTGGVITLTTATGSGYSVAPIVVFGQPSTPGGFGAQGVANIGGGLITSITITNPGSGYKDIDILTVNFVGGTYVTPGTGFVIPTNKLAIGFIGQLPTPIEIGTAGNKSMLAADFTQINDMGYGIVLTNNARVELVSVFTYYTWTSYYALNGAEGRSLNGSTVYGKYGIKAEGADPNEVPVPVRLTTNQIQTATVVSGTLGTLNAINTSGSTSIYINGYSYVPYSQSILEIDHGAAVDTYGNTIGIATYDIIQANTVSNVVIPNLVKLDLSSGGSLNFTGGAIGLKFPVSTGTNISIRSNKIQRFSGINAATLIRPSTALQFVESTSTTYHVLGYDSATDGVVGDSRVTTREAFNYVVLQVPIGIGSSPVAGVSSVTIYQLSDLDRNRIYAGAGSSDTQLIFAWQGNMYKVTNYTTSTNNTATIAISPTLITDITSGAGASTVAISAGLQAQGNGEITVKISNMRVSNHDMARVGSGSFNQSNVPNDILGPATQTPSSTLERIEVGKGRVFAVTTDQDGNFKVGDFFQVDQGTGDITFSASLNLTQVDGIGFKRGVVVKEFSVDDTISSPRIDSVPTERAMVQYLDRRLGISVNQLINPDKLGFGFLDLDGRQPMVGNIDMAGNFINMGGGFITNLTTATTSTYSLYVANKGYVDSYTHMKLDRAGTSAVDPISGVSTPEKGVMLGKLMLSEHPTTSTSLVQAVTRKYVDQVRAVNTLSDVTYTNDQDGHFLMLADVMPASTSTSRPLWVQSRRIVNVVNSNTSNIIITKTAAATVANPATTASWLTMTINVNTITNAMINESAAIVQSKLNMSKAGVGSTSTGQTQADLGLAKFDDMYFLNPDDLGWITLKTPGLFPINAQTASKVNNALTKGSYINYSAGTTYDGSAGITISVNATEFGTVNAIVARDYAGNFTATTITSDLKGNLYSGGGTPAKILDNGTSILTSWFKGSYVQVCSITHQGTSGTGNIGQSDNLFGIVYANTFCGNATSAQYGDLAEKYQADQPYPPCTVLEFGGACEVTLAQDGTRRVAGVVSTNPAHLMNTVLTGENTVALALTGRVPCKVRGKIQKGDMMVSAGDGYARADYTPVLGSVIGKALEDWDGGEGIIEIVVGRL